MGNVALHGIAYERKQKACADHIALLSTQASIIRHRKGVAFLADCQFIFNDLAGVLKIAFTSEREGVFSLECSEMDGRTSLYVVTPDSFSVGSIGLDGVVGRWSKGAADMLRGVELEYPERLMNLLVACSLQSR